MKKRIFLLLAGSLGAAVAATLAQTPGTRLLEPAPPSAGTMTRQLPLPAAERLDISAFADVTVREGQPQQVEVTGPAYLLDQLQADVRNGVLRVRSPGARFSWLRPWLRPWRPTERLKIRLTLPALTQLRLAGAGNFTGLTPLTAPALAVALAGAYHLTLAVRNTRTSVAISGAGTVTVRGTTTAQDVRISGAGRYYAFELKSADTAARISGAGAADVRATNSLTAQVSGIGTIRYRGQPATVAGRVSGLGKVAQSE